jgi:hypothetical protein
VPDRCAKKARHDERYRIGTGHDEQVTVVDQMELAVGDQRCEEPRVERVNQPIVRAGEDERRLLEQWQPAQARPAEHRPLLIQVADRIRQHELDELIPPVIVGRADASFWKGPQAIGRCERSQRRPARRKHQRASTGRGEDQPPAAMTVRARELLRERATPGNAERVDGTPIAELVEQRVGELARLAKPCGCRGSGDSPMPGTSNSTTSTPSSAHASGSSSSIVAPRPLNAMSGERSARPGLTATRRRWSPIRIMRTSMSLARLTVRPIIGNGCFDDKR